MKKLALAIVALTLIFTSCSSESKVKDTVEKYHESVLKADFESAKKYSTKESEEIFDYFIEILKDEEMKKLYLEEMKELKFKIKEIKIGADKKTAEAIYEIETIDGKTEEQTYKLIKEGSNWLVDMKN